MPVNIEKHPDEDHLYLLSIFHYCLAAMSAFAGCTPIFHVGLGIAMLAGAFDGGPNPPPRAVGALFTGIGITVMLVFWTWAAIKFYAGRCLANHVYYRFCFVVACLECVQVPLGTALGVFTILVLNRDSVKALFAGIPYRDPRLAALDAFDDADAPPDRPSDGESDSIREGTPT